MFVKRSTSIESTRILVLYANKVKKKDNAVQNVLEKISVGD